MRHNFPTNNTNANTLLPFLAGVMAATALGGYYLYGPRGEKNQEKLSRWTSRAKREILKKMEDLGDVTEEKYHSIVDEVTDRYSEMSHVGREKATQAAQTFRDTWEDMRDMVAEAREQAEREVTENDRERDKMTSNRSSIL